jgi:hypothetical protein
MHLDKTQIKNTHFFTCVFPSHALTGEDRFLNIFIVVGCFVMERVLEPWEINLYCSVLDEVVVAMFCVLMDRKRCAWHQSFFESVVHTAAVHLA